MNENGHDYSGLRAWILISLIAVMLLCIANVWVLVSAMATMNDYEKRTRQIEGTRFTYQDGVNLRAEVL